MPQCFRLGGYERGRGRREARDSPTDDNCEEDHPGFGGIHCDLVVYHAEDEELVVIYGGVVERLDPHRLFHEHLTTGTHLLLEPDLKEVVWGVTLCDLAGAGWGRRHVR